MEFDITTDKARMTALNVIGSVFTPVWIPLFKEIWGSPSKSNTLDQQRDAAIELIKAGKSSGAKKIKITLDQDAGISLGTSVDGVPIKIKIGKSGHCTIEATY